MMDVAKNNESRSGTEFNAGSSNNFMGSKSQFVRHLLLKRLTSKQYAISASGETEAKESIQSMVRRRVLGLPKCNRPPETSLIRRDDSVLSLTYECQQEPHRSGVTRWCQPVSSPPQHLSSLPTKEPKFTNEQNEQRKRLHIFQQQKLKQMEELSRKREAMRQHESSQTRALRMKRKLAKQARLESLTKKKQNDEAFNYKAYNEWLQNQRTNNVPKNSESFRQPETLQNLSSGINESQIPQVPSNSIQVNLIPCEIDSRQVIFNTSSNVEPNINCLEDSTVLPSSLAASSCQINSEHTGASALRDVDHYYLRQHSPPAADTTENSPPCSVPPKTGDNLTEIGYLSSLLELADAAPNSAEGSAAMELVVAQAVLLDHRALAALLVRRTLVLTEAGQQALAATRMEVEPILSVLVRRAMHEQKSSEDLERQRGECSRSTSSLSPRAERREEGQDDESLEPRHQSLNRTSKANHFSQGLNSDPSLLRDGNLRHCEYFTEEPLNDLVPSNNYISTRDVMIGGRNTCQSNDSKHMRTWSSPSSTRSSNSFMDADGTSNTHDSFPGCSVGNESLFLSPGRSFCEDMFSSFCFDDQHFFEAAPVADSTEGGVDAVMEPLDNGQSNQLTSGEFAVINGDGNGPIMVQVIPVPVSATDP